MLRGGWGCGLGSGTTDGAGLGAGSLRLSDFLPNSMRFTRPELFAAVVPALAPLASRGASGGQWAGGVAALHATALVT
jgi:hypothetical protein